ncbi:MAG: hypothetical protein IPF68_00005, partial [Bacteroidales bacterium]|nr:hypothetical protein [Bacteroidales bacterium]
MKTKLRSIRNSGALLALVTLLLMPGLGWGQIAAWDFFGEYSPATSAADVFNANLSSSNLITRGSGAAASTASNSFRTIGFSNNGISTTNTDYFQITITAATGYKASLSTIDARFAGTASFCVSPGVSTQFAYSLDGSTFTLIGSPQAIIGTPGTLAQIDLTGISDLQNVTAGTTITIRYYASGRTTTGGWGFNSPSSGVNGLAIGGTVEAVGGVIAPTIQASNITFSGIGQNGMTANWTNGDGAKRVVIMNTSNSFNAPADGTDPTANTIYSGSGEQVVYNNSGNSVAVTGLSASTTYWFRAYEYNGSGATTKYLTSAATNNPNSQATAAPAPIIAAPVPTSLSGFSTVAGTASTAQTFTISGTNLTANLIVTAPTNYEVRENESGSYGSSVSFTPSSGTVTEKTIQVRIAAGASVGSPSGNVVCSTIGATSQNVAVSGTVSAPPTITFYFRGPSWMNNNPHNPQIWGPYNGWATPPAMTYDVVPGWWSVTVVVADASASIEYQSRFSQDGTTKYQKAFENFSANATFTTTTDEIWIDASQNESFSWSGNDFYLSQNKITQNQPANEPANHATVFSATANSSSILTVSWTDSDAASYLIKGSDVGYGNITAPADGTAVTNASLVRNVGTGVGTYQFTGLTANTTYYFKIYPYNGVGDGVNYKTDGSVPEDDATTPEAPSIIINEVDSDTPGTDAAEFIELYDGGAGNTPLDGYVVVLFNGSNDLSYAAYDLDGFSTDANDYFVIGNTGVPGVSIVFAGNFLQNGADGVALYTDNASNFPNNTPITSTNLVDALVYDTNDGDDAGLLVLLNSGEPQVSESGRLKGDLHSSQRLPNGSGGARNTSTYDQTLPTPGAANDYADISWTGTTNTDWTISTNWIPNYIPDIVSNAIIPDVTNDPVISATAVCMDMNIAASAVVEIASTGALTVAGTLSNSGSLNIKSTATGTGSLIHNTAGVSANVERYIAAAEWTTGTDGWHLLSSPVAAQSISGDWTPSGTGNDYDMYIFDETKVNEYWLNQKVPANNITSFLTGKGYLVAYEQSGIRLFTGTLNSSDVTLSSLSNSGIASAYPGWHLVGNPFASAIDYDLGTWTKTNIDVEIQVWDEIASSYKTSTEVGGI